MHHIFFICSSVDGHLGFFNVMTIVNSAAMDNGVHLSFQIMVWKINDSFFMFIYFLNINLFILIGG